MESLFKVMVHIDVGSMKVAGFVFLPEFAFMKTDKSKFCVLDISLPLTFLLCLPSTRESFFRVHG